MSNDLGCLTDLMSTVAAVVGTKLPSNAGEDSYNLLPALLGTHHGRSGTRSCTTPTSACSESVRATGNWNWGSARVVSARPRERNRPPGGPAGQLYDHSKDPAERYNLYQTYPDVVERLSRLLEKYQSQGYSRAM